MITDHTTTPATPLQKPVSRLTKTQIELLSKHPNRCYGVFFRSALVKIKTTEYEAEKYALDLQRIMPDQEVKEQVLVKLVHYRVASKKLIEAHNRDLDEKAEWTAYRSARKALETTPKSSPSLQ